jgi:glycosyltransferase involved in cell wall biosynthesis
MACGIPVVTTDVGDCSSLVQGAGRVVTDNSPDTIAQAALDVLQGNNWDDFSAQAVRNATQFSWPEVTRKLMQVYHALKPGVSS